MAPSTLTLGQRRAIDVVAARAAPPEFVRLVDDARIQAIVEGVREQAHITLNFHPDRLSRGGLSVAQSMNESGVYRSQFETKISNGSLSAFAGGERDEWERSLFDGAYHDPPAAPGDRPKYGGLNLFHHPDGASPRFGSCYVRLKASVLPRATFTFGDSHLGPAHAATIGAFEVMLGALFESVDKTRFALGLPCADEEEALALLEAHLGPSRVVGAEHVRTLDDYIEAQVHGDIHFHRDAAAIVVDPSFRDTRHAEELMTLASRTQTLIEWHRGFRLAPAGIDDVFRGPLMRPLAEHLCTHFGAHHIDAALIGRAAAELEAHPDEWRRWGEVADVRQLIKKLWHTLLAFGA